MKINAINPATGKTLKTYTAYTAKQASAKIDETHKAWLEWRKTTFKQRADLLKKAAKLLLKNKQTYAELMTAEMGKPILQGIAEVEKCAACCTYYAENGDAHLADQIIKTEALKSYASFQPVGVVLAIMPWNFPFWQLFRFLAPALMAGNCGVLKHASNVPGCAMAIEEIVKEAGFPEAVFQTLLVGSKDIDALIEHPKIVAVTLTGSTPAGQHVAQKAGSMIKKTVLELGGSDAYIILEDADLELAAETCVNSRIINSGQSCIAAKRFIVVKSVEKEFTELFVRKMSIKIVGDPTKKETDIGPMARLDLREELHEQVKKSMAKGAIVLLGGNVPDGPGAYYPPTVLSNVKKGMPAHDEELFGPVAAIITAKDEEDALRIANDSSFGLGGAIFTKNKIHGEELAAKKLEAGACFVNTMVKSDPRLPFGGIKESGYGRELGLFGIYEFVNIKTVYVA